MRVLAVVAMISVVAACTARAPLSGSERADRLRDVSENHPHPPATPVSAAPYDPSFNQLRCWNNGEDTVCSR